MAGRLCRIVASEIACKVLLQRQCCKNAKTRLSGVYMLRKDVLFSASRSILCAFGQANLFYNSLFQLLVPFCFQGIAFLSKIAYTIFEQNAMH